MKNNKIYWIIFILLVLLLGITFLLAGGFFDNNKQINMNDIRKQSDNLGIQKTKEEKQDIEDDDIAELKNIDLSDTDIDFEMDGGDFSEEEVNLSSLDNENLNLSSVDSEIY